MSAPSTSSSSTPPDVDAWTGSWSGTELLTTDHAAGPSRLEHDTTAAHVKRLCSRDKEEVENQAFKRASEVKRGGKIDSLFSAVAQ